jgi:hypothetical protein
VHEQDLPRRIEARREVVDPCNERCRRHTGADEAVAARADGKGSHAPAGNGRDVEDAFVVGLDEVGFALDLQRRRKRDDGDLDSRLVEKGEAPVERMRGHVDLEALVACELEPRTDEPRRHRPALERTNEGLRPEVLVNVDRPHGPIVKLIGRKPGSAAVGSPDGEG